MARRAGEEALVWDCLLWLLAGVASAVCGVAVAYFLFVGWLFTQLTKDEW
jgi:hypothetical protein